MSFVFKVHGDYKERQENLSMQTVYKTYGKLGPVSWVMRIINERFRSMGFKVGNVFIWMPVFPPKRVLVHFPLASSRLFWENKKTETFPSGKKT